MLTITCPDPSGNINISGDNLRRIITTMGFEFMIMVETDMEEVRRGLDPDGTNNVKIADFARYLDEYVSECTNDEALTEAFK